MLAEDYGFHSSWKETLNYFVQQNHTNSRNDYTEDDIIKMMDFFKAIQLTISMLK